MVYGTIVSSPGRDLSLRQVLDLSNIYLENAHKLSDLGVILALCHNTEVSLSLAKKAAKRTEDTTTHEEIASIYIGLGDLVDSHGHRDEARAFFKKSKKWGALFDESGRPIHPPLPKYFTRPVDGELTLASISPAVTPPLVPATLSPPEQVPSNIVISQSIFATDVDPPAVEFNPPEPETRLNNTSQLAYCLSLLKNPPELDDKLDLATRTWLQETRNEPDEQERLKMMATDVVKAFKREEFKDAKAVAEVVLLAPVLEKEDFRYLLKEFYTGITQCRLLDIYQLEGLASLIEGANAGFLDADDLVKVLELLSNRLRDTHDQSTSHLYLLTDAVSRVLDAMADVNVKGLGRVKLYEPLSAYLSRLTASNDTYLVYQAVYACQALLRVPDDESIWQETFRRTGKVIQGVSGIVCAVRAFDLVHFMDSLNDIQQGLSMVRVVTSLANSQTFLDCLKEGLSVTQKFNWYPALRGADTLIRRGQLAEFKRLVSDGPCQHDPAFQLGVCQRLGDIAADAKWAPEIRDDAIAFLGDMYRNDSVWGDQENIKHWILTILMQLSARTGKEIPSANALIQELQSNGDDTNQDLHRSFHENDIATHPLKTALTEVSSPSLLDRVQERPDVEGNIRQLRRQRLKERESIVYIQPQAKSSVQARNEAPFSLIGKVEKFLASDQKVFLLLGDSGAGKSFFNRELERHLWNAYEKRTGVIPLFVNLPAIDKPERDMIAKQLRTAEFTEPQIREMKLHRTFILICDGYDESQQTHNLYITNQLNQPGEWSAKMIVSCRTEYLGVDYRDRFQPVDRNHSPEPSLFQEAVITPFSMDQVQEYITQYVSVHRPLWEVSEYKNSLDNIPSLKELVRNPFLMSLSLEVLPRMVDPDQDLSATQVTRVELYDQFIEHWLERGKKRLGEKNLSPLARAAFESLSDEGFTQNGIEYLKNLCVAIYKEQDGNPIVRYSRFKDDGTWKADFFSREEEKQILREACPLIRNGNRHRFVHRSLLEYGLALAIFDPQDWKDKEVPEPVLVRRGSTSSVLSSIEDVPVQDVAVPAAPEQDRSSPLAWRLFVNEPSVLQFLEERVQQEPLFKDQLLDYIEKSKTDRKWRTAAANAITILVRARVQFNCADLQGIQIPKADLSYGMFDSAQLQGADLRHVDFRGTWLRQANLSNARMSGVQFGELPYLEQDAAVELCEYSPDGKTIAVISSSRVINVYSTTTCECLCKLSDHDKAVSSIMYSPDGNRLFSGSQDATLRLWEIKSGECLKVLSGHSKPITSVAYSPLGGQIASASHDMTARIWDAETGDYLYTLTGHTGSVCSVKYSSHGHQIASASEDCTVRLWDAETRECSRVLIGHTKGAQMVAYSPKGDQVVSISEDQTARLWDTMTGECRHVFAHERTKPCSVAFSLRSFSSFIAFSPKGDQVATVSQDGLVRLWDFRTGVRARVLVGHGSGVRHVAYSRRGDLIATASYDNTVRLWDTATGVQHQTLTGHSNNVSSVMFSPKDDQIASTSEDETMRLWDVRSGASRHVSSGHNSSVWKISCSPKGDQIATCGKSKKAHLWDVKTGSYHTLHHYMVVNTIAYSPRGDLVATGSSDCSVWLWNARSGAFVQKFGRHRGKVTLVAFSPQGDQIASASHDKTVRIWDVVSRECRSTLEGHEDYVLGVVYSPSGHQVASWSWDGTVRLWDAQTGSCSHRFTGLTLWPGGVAYSPQGHHIASACMNGTVQLWDVTTGECGLVFNDNNKGGKSITYSPKGDQLVASSMDGSIQFWDTLTGDCVQSLVLHDDWVNRTVYSPQGDMLATASYDKTVRIWDVASGECRATIQDFQGAISDIAWIEASSSSLSSSLSPDANYLVTSCHDGSVRMWEVTGDGGHCQVRMRWGSINNALVVRDANIMYTEGLNELNSRLLKQRGAIDPVRRLRDSSKRVAAMASVVSKFKPLSDKPAAGEGPSPLVPMAPSVTVEQADERAETSMNPLFRGLVATFGKDTARYK